MEKSSRNKRVTIRKILTLKILKIVNLYIRILLFEIINASQLWCLWHDMTHAQVERDSSTCVTWLIRVCDMTYSPVWHDSFTCVRTHSHVWHDSFTCVTWLIHMCDMTHSHVWHGIGLFIESMHDEILSPYVSLSDDTFSWHILSDDTACLTPPARYHTGNASWLSHETGGTTRVTALSLLTYSLDSLEHQASSLDYQHQIGL